MFFMFLSKINLVFYSLFTTFELRSKILTFEKTQIYLDFYSLIRIFAPNLKS